MTALLTTLLYIVFVLTAIVLVVVILLQEGKGGGFGDALGTAGQQAFGVKATGVQRFTAGAAVVLLLSAIGIHWLNRSQTGGSLIDDVSAPAAIDMSPAGTEGGGNGSGG